MYKITGEEMIGGAEFESTAVAVTTANRNRPQTVTKKMQPPRKRRRKIAVDLFCGAGGTSTGLVQMCEEEGIDLELVAINHWDKAIATHSKNHTKVRHLCQSIDTINPLDVVPGGRLDILIASPSCIHHSRARAGRPKSDQQRADPWLLMRWIDMLYVDTILLENVAELRTWGPLTAKGQPDKKRKGEYFKKFIDMLRVNYTVEYRILNCADYGDASSRQRFFLIAKRNKKQIVFPEPTHISRKELEKLQKTAPLLAQSPEITNRQLWRGAKEIIEWDKEGESIFNRKKKPLVANTIRRIFAGLFRYSLAPFIVGAGGTTGQQQPRDINDPMNTILTKNSQGVATPYIINMKGKNVNQSRSIDDPTFTQTTKDHQFLVSPEVIPILDEDGRTQAQASAATPYIVPCNHGAGDVRTYSIEEPMRTITGSDAWACIEPLVVNMAHTKNNAASMCRPVDTPLPTVCGKAMLGLIDAAVMRVTGSPDMGLAAEAPEIADNSSQENYLDEVQLVDIGADGKPYHVLYFVRFGILIDIKFRMLQATELARATSFPEGYYFAGTRQEKVKQIGNAVPCETAKALCRAAILGKTRRESVALWN